MQRETGRRAVLGGLAAATVGGTGALLARSRRGSRARWLRPVDPLAASPTWAYFRGAVDRDAGRLAVEVATRARGERGRRIEVFADAERPARSYMPALRGYWRFEAAVDGRSPGRYAVRVGDARLPVALVEEAPPHHDARVELTPRVTWRSPNVAHARGYSTGDGSGRVHVAFRERTGEGSLDAVAFRDPAGRVLGRRPVPDGVRELSFGVDPLTDAAGDGELVGVRDGRAVDAVPMFYH